MIEPRTPELAAQSHCTLAGNRARWASRSLLAKDQQEQPQALPNAYQAKAA